MLKLYITEKPSAAKDLADALGIYDKNQDGFYERRIPDTEENVTVIAYAAGHFVTLKEPVDMDERYGKWNLADLPITYQQDYLKPIKGKEAGLAKLKKYLNKADILVNAGDAGREGELIQRWIQKLAGSPKKVYRLWASSLTKPALIKADLEVKSQSIYNNLYAAGEARAIMDAQMGFNLSRAISLTKTDGVTVTYGRCQSPLLQAIVTRDSEVENFISVPFSFIKGNFQYEGEIFEGVLVDENEKRIEVLDEQEAAAIIKKITSSMATVVRVDTEEKVQRPPKPYDLLTLQKEMARRFSYDAEKTLELCQSLYDTHKILSYPRTDSEYLTSDLKDEVKLHLDSCSFGPYAALVKKAGAVVPDRYFNDKKVADHHGLIPVGGNEMEKRYYNLSEEERNVFDFVVRRFISLFYQDHIFDRVKVTTKVDGFSFLSKGKTIKQAGYMEVYSGVKVDEEAEEETLALPNLTEGMSVTVLDKSIVNDKTKPKKRYSTDSLLTLMKMYNIGTGATRANLIKELTIPKGKNKDCYVQKKGNSYISTPFGRQIIQLIPDDLKSLDLLASLDEKLREIEEGRLSKDDFLTQLIASLKKQIDAMAAEKTVQLKSEKPAQKMSSLLCPRCGRSLIAYDKGYGCSGYKDGECQFFIGNRYGNKKLSEKTIGKLLKDGKTEVLKGFISKAGKKFDAGLIYKDEKIKYDFMKK